MNAELQPVLPDAVTMTLLAIESELSNCKRSVERAQWRIAELLWGAREHFDDDKSFEKWASEKSGYALRTTRQYLTTYNTFKDNAAVGSNQRSENPIPFSKLAALGDPKIKSQPRQQVIKKLLSKKPPTEKQVRQAAREAKPGYQKPDDAPRVPALPTMNADFDTRAQQELKKERFWSPWHVLDLAPSANVETVKMVAKFWKQKHHPDRGGNIEVFQLIDRSEKAILKARGA